MELFTAVAIGAPCNTRTVAGAFLGRTVRSFVTPERTLRFGRFGRCSCTTFPSEAESVSPEEGVLLWPPRVPAGAGTSRFLCDAAGAAGWGRDAPPRRLPCAGASACPRASSLPAVVSGSDGPLCPPFVSLLGSLPSWNNFRPTGLLGSDGGRLRLFENFCFAVFINSRWIVVYFGRFYSTAFWFPS